MEAIKKKKRRHASPLEWLQKVLDRPTQTEGRDPERIKLVFDDIKLSLEKVRYYLQSDFPGLTEDEKGYILYIKEQVDDLIALVR